MRDSFPLIAILLAAVSIGIATYGYFESGKTLAVLGSRIDETVVQNASTTAYLEGLVETLALESDTLEALQKKQEEAISGISQNVSRQETHLEANDVSKAVTRWSPHVYRLECIFITAAGDEVRSRGSAVFQSQTSGIRFLTSKHALERDGAALDDCTLTHPDKTVTYMFDRDDFTVDQERDLAFGTLSKITTGFPSAKVCTHKPSIGDQILTLGYPSIGSDESITATEGIISGFDADYYLSSAKIDRGNSGGGAIDLLRDCFLGVPTLTVTGRAESLARILPL